MLWDEDGPARRPATGASQQSFYCNNERSCSPKSYRFKVQTFKRKFPVSPILHFLLSSIHPKSIIEFTARFGLSATNPPATNSFIEFCSPSSPMFSVPPTHLMATSPPEFPKESHNVKPPLPTAHKPVFSRHPSLLIKKSSASSHSTNLKPATTNFLDEEERADLVRKSRKLARLFGETPNAAAVVNRKNSEPDTKLVPHHRYRGLDDMNTFGRRYSLPLSVDDIPFIDLVPAVYAGSTLGPPKNESASSPESNSCHHERSSSPVSFLETLTERLSISTARRISVSSSHSSKSASIDLLEEERQRKRERLAKLYRFLGSQVPTSLALGINDDSAAALPPLGPQKHRPSASASFDYTENRFSTSLRRRRSSSAVLSPSTWPDDPERLKADLDDREKAIIVRRAQKMEKLFGVAPPLTLYHPKSPSAPSSGSATPSATPPLRTDDLCRSDTIIKPANKMEKRPDTPESSKQLLSGKIDSFRSFADHRAAEVTDGNSHSTFYEHYEHSLNSLSDIVDQDDKELLAELHQVLRGDLATAVPRDRSLDEKDDAARPTPSGHPIPPGHDRLCSLPARTSIISLDSEYSIGTQPMPDATSFQQRRKRAAKLTHFFGVDYRELFDDVLDRIESNMQLGQRDGRLHAAEAEDLRQKLGKLRYKRQNFT